VTATIAALRPPAAGASARAIRRNSIASGSDRARGVPDTRFSPIERPNGRGRVGRADERLTDERGIETDRSPAADGRRVADAGLADDDPIVRHQGAEADGSLRIDVEGPQIAVVQPDDPGTGRERAFELLLVMSFDERLEANLQRSLDEAGQPLRGMEDRKKEDQVGAGCPQVRQLDRFDDEFLGEHGDRDGGPNGTEVVDRATEPVRLAQDRDRGRAAGFVGPRPRDDVLVVPGDLAGRRGASLDLRDDVEPGRGEPVENGPGRPRPGGNREVVVEREAGHLGADVGAAARGDLGNDVSLAGGRALRPRLIVWPSEAGHVRAFGDRHAGAPSGDGVAAATASAARRSSRSFSSNSVPRPASIVSPARSIPDSSESAAPATISAAPALRSTTSRRAPGSPRSTDSVIRALSAADPPASFAVAARRRPRADASTARLSTPDGVTS
jgi:hypothetical protein